MLVNLQPQEVVRLEIEGGGVETGLKRQDRVKRYIMLAEVVNNYLCTADSESA